MVKHSCCKLILILLVFAFGLTACANLTKDENQEGLIVSALLPKRALSQGQLFDLEVLIENKGAFNAEIEAIILPADFVTGVGFLGTQPAMPRQINNNGDWSFEFKRAIAPQGAENVLFSFETAPTGSFNTQGKVETAKGSYAFNINLTVIGVNPVDWKPGVAKTVADDYVYESPYLSVVKIDAVAEVNGQRMLIWQGTGTIISPDGLILTSADVVLSDRYFQVTDLIVSLTVDDKAPPVPTYQAGIVQADFELGLAVIKPRSTVDGKAIDYALLNLPVIKLGDSTTLERGTALSFLGYPALSKDPEILSQNAVVLNDFGAEFPFGENVLIHAELAIPAGNVGAPVLNEANELLAVPIHKSPVTFDPDTVPCQPLVDGNRDGRIDHRDPCHSVNLPIDTLRPIHLALPMIEAAKRAEIKIKAFAHSEGPLSNTTKTVGQDDFLDNRNQWKIGKSNFGELSIQDGKYTFRLRKPMATLWSQVAYGYDDMLIEVDAHVFEPVGNGEFGLLCGVNGEDRTVFAVSENGYFAIWKVTGDETRYIRQWQYSPLINSEEELRLSARCGAEGFTFAVNGQILARGVDFDFVPGLTGLYAATYDEGSMVVSFDNFTVSIKE